VERSALHGAFAAAGVVAASRFHTDTLVAATASGAAGDGGSGTAAGVWIAGDAVVIIDVPATVLSLRRQRGSLLGAQTDPLRPYLGFYSFLLPTLKQARLTFATFVIAPSAPGGRGVPRPLAGDGAVRDAAAVAAGVVGPEVAAGAAARHYRRLAQGQWLKVTSFGNALQGLRRLGGGGGSSA